MFFAFVIDVFSPPDRRLAARRHMRTDLVLDALRMALDPPRAGADVELVHHSDRRHRSPDSIGRRNSVLVR